MSPQYYVRIRGKVLGPFALTQLQAMKQRGALSPFHEVSENRTTWAPASSLLDVFGPLPQTVVAVAKPAPGPGAGREGGRPPDRDGGERQWFYMDGAGGRHGPVNDQELCRLVQQGVVAPHTSVWRDGMAEWLPAVECAELQVGPARAPFPALGPAPGAPEPVSFAAWEQRVQWSRARTGLTLVQMACAGVVGNVVLTGFGVLAAWLGRSPGGVMLAVFLYVGIDFIAKAVATVGFGFGAAVPPRSGARGFGIAALCAALLHLALYLLPFFAVLYLAVVALEPLDLQLRSGVALGALNILFTALFYLSAAARNVLHLLYLQAVGRALKDAGLVQGVNYTLFAYLFFAGTSAIGWILLLFTAASGRQPGAPHETVVFFVLTLFTLLLAGIAWMTWFVLLNYFLYKARRLITLQLRDYQ